MSAWTYAWQEIAEYYSLHWGTNPKMFAVFSTTLLRFNEINLPAYPLLW